MNESPDALHQISILLTDRVNVSELNSNFKTKRVSQKARSIQLNSALQAKANATQPAIIDFLKNQNVAEESIKSYWITNVVFAEVSNETIQKLQKRKDIAQLDLNGKIELENYMEESCEALPPLPDGVEPGLKAINAHKLWAMGYTGRGVVAMGADTGIDDEHVAIPNYRGKYRNENETWFDGGNNSFSPNDCQGHGTHTLGTMIGIDRLRNDTIGVAFNANWIGAQIITCSSGNGSSSNIASWQWALNPDGNPATVDDMPAAINNSWWAPDSEDDQCNENSIYRDILEVTEAAGIAVIFSAGNSGPSSETITAPKNISLNLVNIFSVGNIDANSSNLFIANSSSRGPSICLADSTDMMFNSLNIKPEVSAPGSNVRSAHLNGTYRSLTGTSMAAPHVAGAILLLKEAFPDLMAYDFKMALYMSARDLGDQGEDNTFGMGIIDVEAAFNYLVAEGHTPVDPALQNDVVLINVDGPPAYCGNLVYPEVLVENLGSTTLNSLEIHMEFPDISRTEVFTWTGSMEPGERMTIVPDEISLPSGTYDINIELKNPNGVADEYLFNNRFSHQVVVTSRPTIEAYAADTPDGQVCENTRALLRNEFELTTPGRITYEWYDRLAGGNLLGTGQAYLTDSLTENTTYYADILVEYDDVGAFDNTIGASFPSPFTRGGIDFSASFPFLLKTVKVFPSQSGFINVVLKDADDNVIQDRDFFVNPTNTEVLLPLNYEVPQGQNMKLEIQQGQDDSRQYVSLYYNRTGGEFPYVIEDVLTLNTSTVGANASPQYWYFYDWKIEHREVCGRTPVRVDVNSADAVPTAAFLQSAPTVDIQNDPTVDFTDESIDAVAWNWNFGDGVTSADQNPTHTYDKVGVYITSLTVTNNEGCTASTIDTVRVIDASSSTKNFTEIEGVTVFPNPTSNQLNIEVDFEKSENVAIQLTDLLGRPLHQIPETNMAKGTFKMNLSGLSSGVYLLVLKTEDGRAVKKILKQ